MDPNALRPAITAILSGQDRASVSAKFVRKQLQAQFPTLDVKAYKNEIDAITMEIYTASQDPEEAAASSSEDEKPLASAPVKSKPKLPKINKVKHASSSAVPSSSPAFALADAAKVKDDSDAEYARQLQAAYDAPSRETRNGGVSTSSKGGRKSKKAKKASKAYISSDEDGSGGGGGGDSDSSLVDDAPKTKKRKKASGASGGDGKARTARERIDNNKGFNKLHLVSPQMAAVTGHDILSRPGCTKMIWRYIKRNGLQDPRKKTEILPDEKLKGVVGDINRITSFALSKHISKHLIMPYDADEHEDMVRDYSDTDLD
ncbi:hypothetical protein JCM10213_003469 [Rhodosporidiobolus nylandii]